MHTNFEDSIILLRVWAKSACIPAPTDIAHRHPLLLRDERVVAASEDHLGSAAGLVTDLRQRVEPAAH